LKYTGILILCDNDIKGIAVDMGQRLLTMFRSGY